jgi:hypothetical protein
MIFLFWGQSGAIGADKANFVTILANEVPSCCERSGLKNARNFDRAGEVRYDFRETFSLKSL